MLCCSRGPLVDIWTYSCVQQLLADQSLFYYAVHETRLLPSDINYHGDFVDDCVGYCVRFGWLVFKCSVHNQ